MTKYENSVKSFTGSELREAVRFYEEELTDVNERTKLDKICQHFRCSRVRAEFLKKAAEFAVKVKAKGI